MPQKTRVGNDRSQSTTDVARRRNRNKKLYKAGARSSVTLAAQNVDRRAAVSEIELALSTHSSRSHFSEADGQQVKMAGSCGERRESHEQSGVIHHRITSSARSSSDCGIVRPSALAVFRLITSSNLVGCSTGRSAGLVAFQIFSTYF